MTENRWLVVLTVAVLVIGAVAGAAVRTEKAQATALAAAAKSAKAKRTISGRPSASQPGALPANAATSTASGTATATTTTHTTTVAVATKARKTASKTTSKTATSTASATTTSTRIAAVGDHVQLGSFKDATLRWRILSLDSKRIVLLSDEVLTAGAYQSDEYSASANDYATSSIRTWLKNQFVPTAFGDNAADNPILGRSSASDVVAGDIAYLLTPSQLERYLPEADDRVADSSAWAQSNPGYGDVPLASGQVYWWLAADSDTAASNVVPVVQTNGAINTRRYAAIASDGVRPALKLNTAALNLKPLAGAAGVYTVSAK